MVPPATVTCLASNQPRQHVVRAAKGLKQHLPDSAEAAWESMRSVPDIVGSKLVAGTSEKSISVSGLAASAARSLRMDLGILLINSPFQLSCTSRREDANVLAVTFCVFPGVRHQQQGHVADHSDVATENMTRNSWPSKNNSMSFHNGLGVVEIWTRALRRRWHVRRTRRLSRTRSQRQCLHGPNGV
jgi:hypothetical protein